MKKQLCAAFTSAALAITSMAVVVSGPVSAQSWKPERPVEIPIGSSAGSPQDHMGRLLQKVLLDNRLVEVPVNPVNKPGGGGAVVYDYVNQKAGDAHYVMIHALSLFTNHITGKSALSHADFTPIAIMGAEYVTVAVRAESPIRTGQELIERLRRDPSSLSIVIGTGVGNATHISLAQALKTAGVDIRKLKTVVFNSPSEGVTALLGGHVDVAAGGASSVLQHAQTGRVRILAIGAPQRLTGKLANVPTWKELGINSAFELWRGLAAPKGLTRAQVQFWDDTLAKVVKNDAWRIDMENNQIENVYRNSADTGRYWKAQYDEAKAVLVELGMAK